LMLILCSRSEYDYTNSFPVSRVNRKVEAWEYVFLAVLCDIFVFAFFSHLLCPTSDVLLSAVIFEPVGTLFDHRVD